MKNLLSKSLFLTGFLFITSCSSNNVTTTSNPANVTVTNNKISDCGNEVARVKLNRTANNALVNVEAATPDNFSHNYKIVTIDLSEYTTSGQVVIKGKVGSQGSLSFGLINASSNFKCSGFQEGELSSAANIKPESSFEMSYNFSAGQVLHLLVEGSWGGVKDSVNKVDLNISVK